MLITHFFVIFLPIFSSIVSGICTGVQSGGTLTLICPSQNYISSINSASWGNYCKQLPHTWCDTTHPTT